MIPKIVPNELCFLAHTRTLAIDGIHLSIDECAQLVRAFSNIACLVCTSSTLVQLYHFAPRASTPAILPLRPAALFVTSGFGGVFPSEWSLPATLASVTHLAIPITPFYTLVTSHLHELRLTHVLLEAIQWHRRPHAQFYVDAIFQFLHMETLVRLVVRYTMTDDAMQAVLCEARAKVQDPRVIFDDTVVAEPASLQDVFLRDSMRGCDAWNPGQACLDCSIPKYGLLVSGVHLCCTDLSQVNITYACLKPGNEAGATI